MEKYVIFWWGLVLAVLIGSMVGAATYGFFVWFV